MLLLHECFCSCECVSVCSNQCAHEVARQPSYRKYSWKRQLTKFIPHILRIHFHGRHAHTHVFFMLDKPHSKHHFPKKNERNFIYYMNGEKENFRFRWYADKVFGNVFVELVSFLLSLLLFLLAFMTTSRRKSITD